MRKITTSLAVVGAVLLQTATAGQSHLKGDRLESAVHRVEAPIRGTDLLSEALSSD
jgi:hypothetical protein